MKKYYQITGQFKTALGLTITNPIIKVFMDITNATADGTISANYYCYASFEAYQEGRDAFLGARQNDGVKVKNFKDFDFVAAGFTEVSTSNFFDVEKAMIEQFLVVSASDITIEDDPTAV